MPPLPSVTDVLAVDLIWNIASDTPARTRVHLAYTGGPPDAGGLNTLAADVQAAAAANLKSLMTSAVELVEVVCTDLSSPSGARGLNTTTFVGSRSGTQMASGVAAVVVYTISRRYRGGKPRSYFPFGTAGDLSNGITWDSTLISNVEAGVAAFFTALIGVTIESFSIVSHVSVSYYEGFTVVTSPTTHRARNVPTPRSTPLVDVITAVTLSPKPGSQRRRYQR